MLIQLKKRHTKKRTHFSSVGRVDNGILNTVIEKKKSSGFFFAPEIGGFFSGVSMRLMTALKQPSSKKYLHNFFDT